MKRFLLFLCLGIVFTGSTAFVIFSSGVANQSGSPGEGTCGSCHGGGAGSTLVSISGSPAFVANQYIPGQTYTVNVNVTNNSFSKFGFDAEILNTSNANAGNMVSGLTGVQIVNSTRKNATHTAPKAGTGSAQFQFVWTAPLSGNAIIYASGNAVDGTGGTNADTPGNATLTLTPDLSAGIRDTITSGITGITVFPNPIKSEFKISYNLLENANVKVTLYDLQGQEIMELSNEDHIAGPQLSQAVLPAQFANGGYLLKLSVNGKQAHQRLIITR